MLSFTFIYSLIPLTFIDHLFHDRHCFESIVVNKIDQDPYPDGIYGLILLEKVTMQCVTGDECNQNKSSRRKERSVEILSFKEESQGKYLKETKEQAMLVPGRKTFQSIKTRLQRS